MTQMCGRERGGRSDSMERGAEDGDRREPPAGPAGRRPALDLCKWFLNKSRPNASAPSIGAKDMSAVTTSQTAPATQRKAPPRNPGRGLRIWMTERSYSPASASACSAVAWSSSWRSASDRM